MNAPGFLQERILGKGSYGTVYKAKRLENGTSYAVKVVNTAGMSQRELEDAVNEIRLMASFKSPFIVSFCEAFVKDTKLFVITEYARLGDLSKLIDRRKRQNRPLLEDDIWRFLIQVTEGLRVLHENGVVHRDIKSANLLLCAPDLVKIGDLGISTVLHNHQLAKTQIGTPLYLAPEIWRRKPYDAKCDMWSLGIVLYEMLNFSFPFVGNSTEDLGRRILAGRIGPIRGGYSQEIVSIVKSLLQTNPDMRPSSKDLMEHPSIKSRLHLIHPVIVDDQEEDQHLLKTIKVPLNIKQVAFPKPSYNDSNERIKPINERIHVKGGQVKKDIDVISTRELMMVADHDWWSPNKLKIQDVPPVRISDTPLSARSPYVPPLLQDNPKPRIIKPTVQAAPNKKPQRRTQRNENIDQNSVHDDVKKPEKVKYYAGYDGAPANQYRNQRPQQKVAPPSIKPAQPVAPRRQVSYVVAPWERNPSKFYGYR